MKQIIDGFEDGEADDGKWHSILISVNQMMVFNEFLPTSMVA